MYLTYYFGGEDGGEVVIESKDYHEIKNPSFAPEVDLYALSLPVNEFTLDVITEDDFEVYNPVELYDDMNGLWASFRIKSADRIQPGVVRLTADTWISNLENATMEPVMYEEEPVSDVLDDILVAAFGVADGRYELDNSFDEATVTGFCPEQSARDRLTWVLFAIGGMVQQSFVSKVQIAPIDDTMSVIPYNRTFYRPEITSGEWVTAVRVTSFEFSEATSQEEWESDDSSYRFPMPWVCVEQAFVLSNNDAPEGVPENVVDISELYLINADNVNDILNRLAAYYFNRTEVSLDCVNNRQFLPGDKVTASMAEDALITGYITQASFAFGVQARSTLKLIGVEDTTGATLIINYLYNNGRIGQAKYFLPVGYTYAIQNPFIDRTYQGRRFVYAPLTESVTGTMSSGTNTVDVNYGVALECYQDNLIVYSVDWVALESGTSIAVID